MTEFNPCPACSRSKPKDFLFCTRCWNVVPGWLRGELFKAVKAYRANQGAISRCHLVKAFADARLIIRNRGKRQLPLFRKAG